MLTMSRVGLGSRRLIASALPAFVPMTKLATEGDSITADGNAGIRQWMAANSSLTSQNFAIGGSGLGQPGDTPNPTALTMFARLPTVIAYNPTDLAFLIAANDLQGGDATFMAGYKSNILTYCANARAGMSNLKRIWIGEVTPRDAAATGFNTNRADLNAWLRTQVGVTIDGIFPYGTNPLIGPDSAALTAYYDAGHLHPTASGQAVMRTIVNAVLDPVLAQATGSTPAAFSFADVTNASLSTDYVATNAIITGMGVGQTAASSRSGSGTLARGTSAFVTTSLAFMNGDVPVPKITSSSGYTTELTETVTIGGTSDTFNVTTAANVTPVGYATVAGSAQEANIGFGSGTWTGSDITVPAGRFYFLFYSNGSARAPSSMKFTKSAVDYPLTQISTVTGDVTLWYADLAAGTYTPSAISAAGVFAYVGTLGIVATNSATTNSVQRLNGGAYNDPVDFGSSQPVNANELGFVFMMTPGAVTRNDGSTQRAAYTVADSFAGNVYLNIATLPATATPSVSTGGANNPFAGYALTSAP